MKFAIIFLSCLSLACAIRSVEVFDNDEELLGDGYIWGRKWDSNRRHECQYVPELQIISCFRGLVECEAQARFEDLNQNYEVFAIGSTDNVNFQLYPRKFSEKQYQDYKVQLVGGSSANLGLFSSASDLGQNQRGIWIKDAVCAKKLVDLVKVINPEPELVQITNQQKVSVYGYIVQLTHQACNDSNEESERSQVIPFGKSLVNDKVWDRNVLENVWRPEDSTRKAECLYNSRSKTLSCFRGLVKCEASLTELKQTFEVFGLGTTDMINYRLYPRNLSDTKYSDYKVQSKSGLMVELSLCVDSVECKGLKVRDSICHQRVVDTLRVLNVQNTVTVDGDQPDAKVSLMGYVVRQCVEGQRKTFGRS